MDLVRGRSIGITYLHQHSDPNSMRVRCSFYSQHTRQFTSACAVAVCCEWPAFQGHVSSLARSAAELWPPASLRCEMEYLSVRTPPRLFSGFVFAQPPPPLLSSRSAPSWLFYELTMNAPKSFAHSTRGR